MGDVIKPDRPKIFVDNQTLDSAEILRLASQRDDFIPLVERCRHNKSNDIIENTSIAHAHVLMKNLMEHAVDQRSDVSIVSGTLMAPFYQTLVPTIKTVLENGLKVKIIVLSSPDALAGNAFYQAVKNHQLGDVLNLCSSRTDETPHFLFTDNAYRVETDDDAKKAYASFNDEGGEVINVLKTTFDGLRKSAQGERNANSGPLRPN